MAGFGGTEFTSFLAPPGALLEAYKPGVRVVNQDPTAIPQTFLDALVVREEVFVDEQKVELANEVDSDDPRSFHWVLYASKGTSGGSSGASPVETSRRASNGGIGTLARAPSIGGRKPSVDATAQRTPIATIRLVPPPFPPHPTTTSHVPISKYHEPYIKITRLAVRQKYRSMGLSRLLISTALKYAVANPHAVVPPPSPAALEKRRLAGEDKEEENEWRGLVLVHAQIERKVFWERFGFVWDEGLGQWDEEGIQHVGLWLRLPVGEK